MRMQVRRAEDRFRSSSPGVDTRHALSSGPHYDPARTAVGPLVALDEHALAAGAGFPAHPHRGLEVVTWVLEGTLVGTDDRGRSARLGPGRVQVLSTGAGVVHEERSDGEPVRFLQAWLVADADADPTPAATAQDVPPGSAVVLASGRGHPGALPLRCRDAVLHLVRLAPGQGQRLAAPSYVHVVRGTARLGDAELRTGDAVVLHRPAEAEGDGELLVWEVGGEEGRMRG